MERGSRSVVAIEETVLKYLMLCLGGLTLLLSLFRT